MHPLGTWFTAGFGRGSQHGLVFASITFYTPAVELYTRKGLVRAIRTIAACGLSRLVLVFSLDAHAALLGPSGIGVGSHETG